MLDPLYTCLRVHLLVEPLQCRHMAGMNALHPPRHISGGCVPQHDVAAAVACDDAATPIYAHLKDGGVVALRCKKEPRAQLFTSKGGSVCAVQRKGGERITTRCIVLKRPSPAGKLPRAHVILSATRGPFYRSLKTRHNQTRDRTSLAILGQSGPPSGCLACYL